MIFLIYVQGVVQRENVIDNSFPSIKLFFSASAYIEQTESKILKQVH